MEQKKRASKKIVTIQITPYLAEYAKKKFGVNTADGSVRIPPSSDLYHCVWNLMQRPPASAAAPSEGNLPISLPSRRCSTSEGPWKDPAYYNYLSATAAHEIETCLRRMFNYEFHRTMMDNEAAGRPRRNADVVDDFMRQYSLLSITSDALLKNYYRYRNLIRPAKKRRYVKQKP